VDVTDRKQAERAVRVSEQRLRQMAENIDAVFWVTDPLKTKFDYVSPEFEKVWGESRRSIYVSPATWIEGIHAEDRERVTRAIFAKQVTGDYDEEYRVTRPDGSPVWIGGAAGRSCASTRSLASVTSGPTSIVIAASAETKAAWPAVRKPEAAP